MLGAIIGDIAGSRFEGTEGIAEQYGEDFEFLSRTDRFTDDTVCTIAIAKAIAEHKQTDDNLEGLTIKYLQKFGRRFLWCGCGEMFYKWIMNPNPQPYGSYGNGAVMRISPCAWLSDTLEQAFEYAKIVTNVTHNHPDSIQGALAITEAIYLAKNDMDKHSIIQKLIDDKLYVPNFDIIKDKFDVTTKGTVNIALISFWETDSFEDCIRKAILYGGDTDTNGAVAGSIAEAYYGIPSDIQDKAKKYLDVFLLDTLNDILNIIT